MTLILQFIIGGGMIALTFIIQAICFDRVIRQSRWIEQKAIAFMRPIWKSCVLMTVVSAVCTIIIIEIWLWAALYLVLNIFSDLETALYFSTTAFTTVGFGDVTLGKDWRMLSVIEAMNGFLIFGWSTAYIWEFITHLYRSEGKAMERNR